MVGDGVDMARKFVSSDHPRGQPENAGQFAKHPLEGIDHAEQLQTIQANIGYKQTPEQEKAWQDALRKFPIKDEPAVVKDIHATAAEAKRQNQYAYSTLPDLYQAAKAKHPDLSLGSFQHAILNMVQRGEVRLHPFTSALYQLPHPEAVIVAGQEAKYYAEPLQQKSADATNSASVPVDNNPSSWKRGEEPKMSKDEFQSIAKPDKDYSNGDRVLVWGSFGPIRGVVEEVYRTDHPNHTGASELTEYRVVHPQNNAEGTDRSVKSARLIRPL
jgi:hypothetical protein